MKKIFGILLSIIILLTSISFPIYAENTLNKDDSRIDIGEIFGRTYKITFVNGENVTEKEYAQNDVIIYPVLTASREYDICWSLSKDELIVPPKTMGKEDIVVYSFINPIISFENYPYLQFADDSMAVKVSSDYFYTGEKSIKYLNMHYSLLTLKPDNWETNYNSYYTESDGKYIRNSFSSAPDFFDNKYYRETPNGLQHTITLGTVTKDTAYKIKFKYYIDNPLKTDHYLLTGTGSLNLLKDYSSQSQNLQVYSSSQMTIPESTQTKTWLDGEIYFTAVQSAVEEYNNIYITFGSEQINQGDCIYFDDFSFEQMVTADFIIPDGFKLNSKNGTLWDNTYTAYYSIDEPIVAPDVLNPVGAPVEWVDEDGITAEFKANGIYRINFSKKGDVNFDGATTILDLANMKLYLVELIDLSTINLENSDIDGNGMVDLVDMAYLKLYLVGLIVI